MNFCVSTCLHTISKMIYHHECSVWLHFRRMKSSYNRFWFLRYHIIAAPDNVAILQKRLKGYRWLVGTKAKLFSAILVQCYWIASHTVHTTGYQLQWTHSIRIQRNHLAMKVLQSAPCVLYINSLNQSTLRSTLDRYKELSCMAIFVFLGSQYY